MEKIEEIRKMLQDGKEDYTLKTNKQLIDMIIGFGDGELEFETVDIERLIRENEQQSQEIEKLKEESNKWMGIAYVNGTNNDINCETIIELRKENTKLKEENEYLKHSNKKIHKDYAEDFKKMVETETENTKLKEQRKQEIVEAKELREFVKDASEVMGCIDGDLYPSIKDKCKINPFTLYGRAKRLLTNTTNH